MVNGYAPASLKEALELRAAHDVIPYAGGTDLMIGEHRAGAYLFLNRVPELKTVIREDGILRLGAGCTFSELIEHPLTPALLKEALNLIAAPAIRNEGTIGGNIANGSAKADGALIFFVADAKLKLKSVSGERVIPIKEFYRGRKQLDLKPDELITEILMSTKWLERYYYKKVGARKALAISRVSFAGLMHIDNGVIRHCATAFGAVSDVVIRRDDTDAMLIGKTVEQAKETKKDYLSAFERAIVPIRGRVSAEYRKKVCLNLLEDFLSAYGI
ncbi:MAG TPA: FAD binding domain-containing protein [Clostridia bacterium]|nr:FAD binding domain-containing protein [Clostridia bacterium]